MQHHRKEIISDETLDDTKASDDVLQEYLAHLEQGGTDTPEQFLARLTRGDLRSATPKRSELLQGLQSIRLILEAGKSLRSHTASDAQVTSGTVLGDFEIVRPLGRGGMGLVFLARQLSLDRLVALKILSSSASFDETTRKRFQLEAHSAASLAHPNIVPVHLIDHYEGTDFFAMQYIAGGTLQQAIDTATLVSDSTHGPKNPRERGSLSAKHKAESPTTSDQFRAGAIDEAIRIAIQIADALDCAHESGIVHRDVKPSNILIDEQGKPWLADFGLAHIDQEDGLTRSGVIVGSIRYISPEQLDPRNKVVDHRCDIYGLGITLFEMITGTPAIQGKDRKTIFNNIEAGNIPSLRKLAPASPKDLETVIGKATRHQFSDRYATAGELANDLKAILEHRPIRATPPTVGDRLAKWSARNRHWFRIAALLTAVLAIIASAAAVQIFQANQRTTRSLAQLSEAKQVSDRNLAVASAAIDSFFNMAFEQLREYPVAAEFREKLLSRSVGYCEELLAANAELQSLPDLGLAHARYQIATVCIENLQLDRAEKELELALSACRSASHPESDAVRRLGLQSSCHLLLARVHELNQDINTALDQLQKAGRLHDEYQQLAGLNDLLIRDRMTLAITRANLLARIGETDSAAKTVGEAVEKAHAALLEEPDDDWLRIRLVEALLSQARIEENQKEYAKAEKTLAGCKNEIISLDQSPAIYLSGFRLKTRCNLRSAVIALQTGKKEEAIAGFRKAVQYNDTLIADGCDDYETRFHKLQATTGLLTALSEEQASMESRDYVADADRLAKQLLGDGRVRNSFGCDLAGALHNLALWHHEDGNREQARDYLNQAVVLSQDELALNPDLPVAQLFLSNHFYSLSRIHFESRQLDECAGAFEQAAKWRSRYLEFFPEDDAERNILLDIHVLWPKILGKLNSWDNAVGVCRSGIEIADELIADHWRVDSTAGKRHNLLIGMTEIATFAEQTELIRDAVNQRLETTDEGAKNIRMHLEYLLNQVPQGKLNSSRETLKDLVEFLNHVSSNA